MCVCVSNVEGEVCGECRVWGSWIARFLAMAYLFLWLEFEATVVSCCLHACTLGEWSCWHFTSSFERGTCTHTHTHTHPHTQYCRVHWYTIYTTMVATCLRAVLELQLLVGLLRSWGRLSWFLCVCVCVTCACVCVCVCVCESTWKLKKKNQATPDFWRSWVGVGRI